MAGLNELLNLALRDPLRRLLSLVEWMWFVLMQFVSMACKYTLILRYQCYINPFIITPIVIVTWQIFHFVVVVTYDSSGRFYVRQWDRLEDIRDNVIRMTNELYNTPTTVAGFQVMMIFIGVLMYSWNLLLTWLGFEFHICL